MLTKISLLSSPKTGWKKQKKKITWIPLEFFTVQHRFGACLFTWFEHRLQQWISSQSPFVSLQSHDHSHPNDLNGNNEPFLVTSLSAAFGERHYIHSPLLLCSHKYKAGSTCSTWGFFDFQTLARLVLKPHFYFMPAFRVLLSLFSLHRTWFVVYTVSWCDQI